MPNTPTSEKTSTLIESFKSVSRSNGLPCGIGRAFKALREDNKKDHVSALQSALDDETITHVAIQIVLKEWGFPLAESATSKHRRGLCSCPTRT